MKKLYSVLFFLAVLSSCGLSSVEAKKKPASEDLLSKISGTVTLFASRKNMPDDLVELYSGRDSTLTTSKKGKVINVEGTNVGGSSIFLQESGVTKQSDAKYSFNIPVPSVISQVVNNFANNAKADAKKLGSAMSITFSNDLPDDEPTGSVNNTVTNINISKSFSVSAITTTRRGNKAILQGSFSQKGTSAKGRFKLNFSVE
jgi:hypothetical protein